MKIVNAAIALVVFVSFPGCQSETTTGKLEHKNSDLPVNCALEFQIALRPKHFEKGRGVNEGEFHVVSSNVFPIQSEGGPGQVISNNDGVIMEIKWDDVRRTQYRREKDRPPEQRIQFKDFAWVIKNPLTLSNGVTYTGIGAGKIHGSTHFNTEFLPRAGFGYRTDIGSEERGFVIRGRLLPKAVEAKTITIPPVFDEIAKKDAG